MRSVGLAAVTCIGILIPLESILPSDYGGGLNDRGLVAAIIGALSGGYFLRGRSVTTETKRRLLKLPLIALIVGPLFGFVLASMVIWLGDVAPIDRAYTCGVFGLIGTVAGVIAAGVFAMIGWSPGRSNKPESTENN